MTDPVSEKEFSRLIYDNQGIIRKVCSIYGRSESEREDLAQEIMIRLWKGLPAFRKESKISTWIYRIALNTAISQQRTLRRRIRLESLPEEPLPDPTPSSAGEEEQVKALYRGIDRLKPLEKAIILLYLEEKSYQEIAEITGLSKSNVSVKLVRIKAKLEKIVQNILQTSTI